MPTLAFRIDATRPAQRELLVTATLANCEGGDIEFLLPTWTPGSYLIREYARHLSRVTAFADDSDRELPCRKTNKNRFLVEAGGETTVQLRYRVYAHELSVRSADLTDSHAYWNHACVLLWPTEHKKDPATISVDYPAGWEFSSGFANEHEVVASAHHATTTLRATDLAHAIDAPILIGQTERIDWQVNDVPHAIVLDGLGPITPPPSLADDLDRIVREAARVFGGKLPYSHYVFLSLFAGEGYGGLEHRDSTTLLMPRTALASERGYRDFLTLAAHELFHAWNVKRMRPAEFWDYDYEQENYTRLLWVMEGWTAYYDDLLVARAGLMSRTDYLASIAKNVQNMRAAPGRFELTLEESSFDAWIRLYRPDENTRNSSQNYYGNGAVAALCLDLSIRRVTGGEQSLDTVLRELYESTFEQGRGYEVADVQRIVERIAGPQIVAQLNEMVGGPLDPQFDDLLGEFGIDVKHRDQNKPFLGVGFRAGTTVVSSVVKSSPAYDAGLAPDDELLAVANLRVTAGNWQSVFGATSKRDEPVQLLIARRGAIANVEATPRSGPGSTKLKVNDTATDEQVAAREAWLGGES